MVVRILVGVCKEGIVQRQLAWALMTTSHDHVSHWRSLEFIFGPKILVRYENKGIKSKSSYGTDTWSGLNSSLCLLQRYRKTNHWLFACNAIAFLLSTLCRFCLYTWFMEKKLTTVSDSACLLSFIQGYAMFIIIYSLLKTQRQT